MKLYIHFTTILLTFCIFNQVLFANLNSNVLEDIIIDSTVDNCLISNVQTAIFECSQTLSFEIIVTFDIVNRGEKGFSIYFDEELFYIKNDYALYDSLGFVKFGPIIAMNT